MYKIGLLWQVKQRIIYRGRAAKITTIIILLLMIIPVIAYWRNQSNAVQIYIVDQERSPLSVAFLNAGSERIVIKETDQENGEKGLRQYQAEAMIIIPQGASDAILSGKDKQIFSVYYLKGNQLAPFLADRIISNVMTEIYDLAGERLLAKLYQEYSPETKEEAKKRFKQAIEENRMKLQSNSYFSIAFTKQIELQEDSEKKIRDNQGKLTELAIIMTVVGINFIFLLYFGLKLLSVSDKNDRIRLAGFNFWQIWISDALIFLLPQVFFLAVMFPFALYYQATAFWVKLCILTAISIFVNVCLIRQIKEKQLYFLFGMAIYLIGVIMSMILLWNQ